jgi:hypothetical protein
MYSALAGSMRQKQSSALSRIKLIGEGFATVAGSEPEMNSPVPHLLRASRTADHLHWLDKAIPVL